MSDPVQESGNAPAELKEKLFAFWDQASEYYESAREYNLTLTHERKKMLEFIPQGCKLLDVGCGSGENAYHIGSRAEYLGLEYSTTALKMAEQFESDHARFMQGDAENLPFEAGSFDVVLSTYVIEHLTNPERVLNEMFRVCKPGGRVILLAPAWEMPYVVPPSCKTKAQNPAWKAQWIWNRFRKLLFADPSFDMIEDPDVLTNPFDDDNDAVFAISPRRFLAYLKKRGVEVEYIQTYPDVAKSWGHHGPEYWYWWLLTRLPMFRYANAGLLLVARKSAEQK